MSQFNWDSITETAMPALEGEVLRRFVSGEEMTLARVAFAPGSVTEAHRHENEQFSIVLSGTMEFTIEGKSVTVQTGEVVYLQSNELHGARALEASVILDVFAPPRADWQASV